MRPGGSGSAVSSLTTRLAEQTVYNIPQKKRRSKWITVGLPLALLVVAAAVVGLLFGLKIIKTGSPTSTSSTSSSPGSTNHQNQDLSNLSYFATSTNAFHQPIYPSMVCPVSFHINQQLTTYLPLPFALCR